MQPQILKAILKRLEGQNLIYNLDVKDEFCLCKMRSSMHVNKSSCKSQRFWQKGSILELNTRQSSIVWILFTKIRLKRKLNNIAVDRIVQNLASIGKMQGFLAPLHTFEDLPWNIAHFKMHWWCDLGQAATETCQNIWNMGVFKLNNFIFSYFKSQCQRLLKNSWNGHDFQY